MGGIATIPLGLATPDHTVPYGTVLRGTLSQALRARLRSVLSLRDALADISQQRHEDVDFGIWLSGIQLAKMRNSDVLKVQSCRLD